MIVNLEAWKQLKESIEKHTKEDSNITDIIINYQVKKMGNVKNFLKLDIKIENND